MALDNNYGSGFLCKITGACGELNIILEYSFLNYFASPQNVFDMVQFTVVLLIFSDQLQIHG